MTNYQTYIPQQPLAAFVEKFWLYEGYKLTHRTEYFVIDTSCLTSVLGIHFKAGGAFPFFKLPADELLNLHVSLDTIWGTIANDLRNHLLEAKTAETKFHILERFLLSIADWPLIHHPAVDFALQEFQCLPYTRTITDVTEQIGLSPRHFIRKFREEVGMTPKQFCRVQRFQGALCLISMGQQIEWTQIALTCGYFDQSHFNHDFRDFSGFNPGIYLMNRSEHHNHVPLNE